MDDISEQPEEDFIGTKQAGFHRASARAFFNQPSLAFPSQVKRLAGLAEFPGSENSLLL